MHGIPDTRASLLIRLRAPGDRDAWQEFSTLYEPLIYRLARRAGFQHADAQDVTQETLAAISQAISRLQVGEDSGRFRGWLFCIARNLIINRLKRPGGYLVGTGDTNIRQLLEQSPDIRQQERSVYLLEYRRELFHWAACRIRKEFQERTWLAFWKTAIDGEAYQATAQQLGISIGALYAARSRVLARLRAEVEELEAGDAENDHEILLGERDGGQ